MNVDTSRKPRLTRSSGFWRTYAHTHHRNAPKLRPVPRPLLIAARGWVKDRNRAIALPAAANTESEEVTNG